MAKSTMSNLCPLWLELTSPMPTLFYFLCIPQPLPASPQGYHLTRWHHGKESASHCRRLGFSPWRRKWQSGSRILAWEIQWTEEPVRLSPWGCKESVTPKQLSVYTHSLSSLFFCPFLFSLKNVMEVFSFSPQLPAPSNLYLFGCIGSPLCRRQSEGLIPPLHV